MEGTRGSIMEVVAPIKPLYACITLVRHQSISMKFIDRPVCRTGVIQAPVAARNSDPAKNSESRALKSGSRGF